MEGGGQHKANENEQGEGVVKTVCTFYLWKKKFPDFSNSKQELFLISCLAVATSLAVLSSRCKGIFYQTGVDIFFSFDVFLWTCKYFYFYSI